jgi:hypothetical protein
MSSAEQGPIPYSTMLGVFLVALLGATLAQVSHEGTHAVAALLVGAQLRHFHLFAVDHTYPSPWQSGVIAGSAAIVNILCAGLCILAFPRIRGPFLRLLVFYFGAYCLFMGFGYLMVDPLIESANPDSEGLGDWARVVKLLGSSWAVRLPIMAVGGAGTVFGYFWMGRAAQHFRWGDPGNVPAQRRLGLVLCILPYVGVNLIYSVLVFVSHPVGDAGRLFTLAQYWLGYSGFFWAFMIKFFWGKYEGPFANETLLPGRLDVRWALGALVPVVLIIALFLRTLKLGWQLW